MRRPAARLLAILGVGLCALLAADPLAHAAPPPTSPATDPGLRQAVRRDLGIDMDEYLRRGVAAERAGRLAGELAREPGFRGVALDGSTIVVSGEGEAVRSAARREGARVEPDSVRRADEIARRFAAEVGVDGVRAVTQTASGVDVHVSSPHRVRPSGRSPEQFARQNPGVRVVDGRGPATRRIQGGEGYSGSGVLCSIGFGLFTGSGQQAMLSAGHCTKDGLVASAALEADPTISVGRVAFSQFGGPGNTANRPGTGGLDHTFFQGSADILGRSTTWGGSQAVTGTATAVLRAPVCTSGRTTRRWNCGTVITVGDYNVQGWRADAADIRWVAGFETDIITRSGDSGGPMLQGLKAVGIVSAGYEPWTDNDGTKHPGSTVGAPIAEAARRGYSVEVWLNTPLVSPGVSGKDVSGRVPLDDSLPPGTQVEVVRADGSALRIAPAANGTFSYSAREGDRLTAVSGYSRSTTSTWSATYGAGPQFCGLRNSGCFRELPDGNLYWSASTSPHVVRGAIRARWGELGYENGRLGYPTSPEHCGLRDGGCFQRFEGGSMYWSRASGAQPVWGAVPGVWGEQGWENGVLGYPVGLESCGAGGCRQDFQGGAVTWSQATGGHWIRGAIADAWRAHGGQQGWLGHPITNEMCGLVEGGCWQQFTGGRIYWTQATGAHPVAGMIGREWDARGYEHGQLGHPVGDEFCGLRDGGCGQHFQRGSIYWSAPSGAHPVGGAIRSRYAALGWEARQLGYPVRGEQCGLVEGGCWQAFGGGSIYFSPAQGTWEVWGAIGAYWSDAGREGGRFGYPRGPERCDAAGCRQDFARGTITWAPSDGARG